MPRKKVVKKQPDAAELNLPVPEPIPEEKTVSEDKTGLDWKEAAAHLKEAVADTSIDRYFKKDQISACRTRFNNRERTLGLYEEIMSL